MAIGLYDYDVVIFDCDGVLIDINEIKVTAFGEAISDDYQNDIVNAFVDHCKDSFGISRYVKFREFFNNFAKVPFNEEKYNQYLNIYSKLCFDAYKSAHITPGALSLLKELKQKGKRVYVASGSDEKELNVIFNLRNINMFFDGIYGSPRTKSQLVDEILKNDNNSKTIFIGDSYSDMKVAKEYNLDFIYMDKYTLQSLDKDKKCREYAKGVVETLANLN
ncbi:HAD family hydrolase [Niallia alba]|uniref:HAD family hydrolase n=1 Tax=Niallia alba TaxID=2729105 RepID=UPI002E1E03A0|nr:HAD family hydrolase [Niallia alba]